MKIHHIPVFANFICEYLIIPTDRYAVDFSLGEGGHSQALLVRGLSLLAFEQDGNVLNKAKNRLKNYSKITYVHDNFENAFFHLKLFDKSIDFALFDLGISNFHYRESNRGFSFDYTNGEEKLDMRLNPNFKLSAADIVNTYAEKELADLLYLYGGEKKSRRIASAICYHRQQRPITNNKELVKIILSCSRHSKIHPATKTFQALRIVVNRELKVIPPALDAVTHFLAPGGRLAVISYHSLEDQIVKRKFIDLTGRKKNFNKYREKITVNLYKTWRKKPIIPSLEEIKRNPSARSAKLRVLVKDDRIE